MKPFKRRMGNVLTKIIPASYKLILLYNYFTTDIYILSFPKSGRTWLRMMLAHVFSGLSGKGDTGDFVEAAKHVCAGGKKLKITFEHEDSRGTRHYELEKDKSRYSRKKVIFMARDPRDVMVSYFFEMTRRKGLNIPDISAFIRDDAYGVDTLLAYMNIWAASRGVPKDFLLVTYEEMHRNPSQQLRRVLEFIGLHNPGSSMLDEAVQFARFENMKKLEKSGKAAGPELKPKNPDDVESYKTRKGRVGGYEEYLSTEDIAYINNKIKEKLSDYYKY